MIENRPTISKIDHLLPWENIDEKLDIELGTNNTPVSYQNNET